MSSKPKVAIGISYFNSVKEIPRLLDPIVKHVDMIIAIDGIYPHFEWPSNVSTDGSTELLESKYHAYTHIFYKPVEQIDKRNKYLEIAEHEKMDWVLVLDTDDYLHPAPINQRWDRFYDDLSKIPKHQLLANIFFYISDKWEKNWNLVKTNAWVRYTRIIRPERIRYFMTHWQYIDRELPETFAMPPLKAVDGCRFTADSTLRTKEYIKKGFEWAKKQMEEENDRSSSPLYKRMRYNYWIRELKRSLEIPGTKVTMDNTKDKVTEKILKKLKSKSKQSISKR